MSRQMNERGGRTDQKHNGFTEAVQVTKI